MNIDGTQFGNITIDGKTYDHDVIIRSYGEVIKRKKKLSKRKYGTSHIVSREEVEFFYEDSCEELILGTGQFDNVRLSDEASIFLQQKACKVIMDATPNALNIYNRSAAKKIGMFHVTC
jgi:hypothetical protein